MQTYEYHVVPAPKRGKKARGVKTGEARFAHALSEVMNELAADGWEYLRTDTLPSEERSGLTGRATVFQNMLVFRRAFDGSTAAAKPEVDVTEISDLHAPKLADAADGADPSDAIEVAPDTETAEEKTRAAE